MAFFAKGFPPLFDGAQFLLALSPDPSYSLIDSQSVKTTSAAENRGIDGGKKIKGRKRHIVTDTQGHLLHVKVHAANTQGRIMNSRADSY